MYLQHSKKEDARNGHGKNSNAMCTWLDLEKNDFSVVISRRIYVQTASFVIIFDTVTDMTLLHIYEAAPNAAERPANAATDNMDSFSFADGMEVDFSEEFTQDSNSERLEDLLFFFFNDLVDG